MLKRFILISIMAFFVSAGVCFSADVFKEVTVVDRIEVLENGHIQVRQAIRVLKNDVVISQKFHRYALEPGANLTGQDAKIVSVATVVWTPTVIQAWQEFKAKQKP